MSKVGPRFRALVLADDPGVRMRPLTGFVPKALLPVAGQPLLQLALTGLAEAGCQAALLRVGSLGETIEHRFGRDWRGMELHYSRASPWTDGDATGEAPSDSAVREPRGPLELLRDFAAESEVGALVPAHRACRWPLRRLVKRHVKRAAAATMLLGPDRPDGPATTWAELQKKGWVSGLRGRSGAEGEAGVSLRSFLGACLVDPRLLAVRSAEGREEEAGSLLGWLRGLIARGEPVLGVETRRPCVEVPDPTRYLLAAREWARRGSPLSHLRRRYVDSEARVEAHVRVVRSVVESGATVERGSRIQDSLVLGGATVGADSRIERSIVAPGVLLSPKTRLSGRLVTPLKAGRAPGADDSVLGDLVYTPIRRV